MGRILAIDYGRKRCGIAVTDPLGMIASPLTTVGTHELIDFLKKYIADENVECLVIGEPRQMDYTASEAEQFIKPFIKQIVKVFPDKRTVLPLIMYGLPAKSHVSLIKILPPVIFVCAEI